MSAAQQSVQVHVTGSSSFQSSVVDCSRVECLFECSLQNLLYVSREWTIEVIPCFLVRLIGKGLSDR
jgi:hypothetical protein